MKGLGIFKLPAAKDLEHKTWREAWLGEITKTREKDADFQKLIEFRIQQMVSCQSGNTRGRKDQGQYISVFSCHHKNKLLLAQ